MQTMSATEVKQALDAAQRAPVVIQKQNRDVAVLMSVQEFEKLRGLRIDTFNRMADEIAAEAKARGLTDEVFEELLTPEQRR